MLCFVTSITKIEFVDLVDKDILMCTDGNRIFISKDFFDKSDNYTIIFGLLHEMYHIIFMHPKRFEINDSNVTIAEENIVNYCTIATLYEIFRTKLDNITFSCEFGKHDFKKEKGKLQIVFCPYCVSKKDDFFSLYKKLKKNYNKKKKNYNYSFYNDNRIKRDTFEKKYKNEIDKLRTIYKSYGNIPGELIEIFDNFFETKPKVEWKQILTELLQKEKIIDGFTTYSNRLKNFKSHLFINHDIITSKIIGKETKEITIAIDTSGSISDNDINNYINEVKSILQNCNCKIKMIQCDCEVQDFREIDKNDFNTKITIKGRGGTDYIPVYNYINKNKIKTDIVLYFTDGCCDSFPKENIINTIWIISDKITFEPPFGKVIYI